MHLKLEEFHFLMIISFISVVSGGVPLCPGQNLEREEAGLRAAAHTSHVSLEVPRDTLPGTAAACEIGFQRGVVLLLGTYGGGDREGRDNKDCDAVSTFSYTEGVLGLSHQLLESNAVFKILMANTHYSEFMA